jgi:hypothetical protein
MYIIFYYAFYCARGIIKNDKFAEGRRIGGPDVHAWVLGLGHGTPCPYREVGEHSATGDANSSEFTENRKPTPLHLPLN